MAGADRIDEGQRIWISLLANCAAITFREESTQHLRKVQNGTFGVGSHVIGLAAVPKRQSGEKGDRRIGDVAEGTHRASITLQHNIATQNQSLEFKCVKSGSVCGVRLSSAQQRNRKKLWKPGSSRQPAPMITFDNLK